MSYEHCKRIKTTNTEKYGYWHQVHYTIRVVAEKYHATKEELHCILDKATYLFHNVPDAFVLDLEDFVKDELKAKRVNREAKQPSTSCTCQKLPKTYGPWRVLECIIERWLEHHETTYQESIAVLNTAWNIYHNSKDNYPISDVEKFVQEQLNFHRELK